MERLVIHLGACAIMAGCGAQVVLDDEPVQEASGGGGDSGARLTAPQACDRLLERLPICNYEICLMRMSTILEGGEREGCPEEAETYVDCLVNEADDGHCRGVEACADKQASLNQCANPN